MSIYDLFSSRLTEKNYDEHVELLYYSRAADGDVIRIERRMEEPGFDTLLHAFLDWCQSVFSWDRKDIKAKALEAVMEWEV
jgi:hypothetical protein